MYTQIDSLMWFCVLFSFVNKLCGATDLTSDVQFDECSLTTCVNVCCKQGEMMDLRMPKASCIPSKWPKWSLANMSEVSDLRPRYNTAPQCPPEHLLRKPRKIKNHVFTVMENGSLQIYHPKYELLYPPEEFCVGVSHVGTSKGLVCRPTHIEYNHVFAAPLLVSAAFLLATMLVHAGFPELRKTGTGFCLIFHCACVLIAHLAYIVETIHSPTLESPECSIYAYLEFYSLLAGAFWLNVICIDIALKFRSLDTMVEAGPLSWRKVAWYSVYALGSPLLVVLTAVWVDLVDLADYPPVLAKLKTNIGHNSCWFDSDTMAEALYCLIPRGLLLLFNIGLFVNTILNIKSFSKQSSDQPEKFDEKCRKNFDVRKNKRLALFAKLLALLGASWLLELIFWSVEFTQQYSDWVIIFFVLLGRIGASFVLFYCFCCKKNVWRLMTAQFPSLSRLPCSDRFTKRSLSASKSSSEGQVLQNVRREGRLSGIDNRASSFN